MGLRFVKYLGLKIFGAVENGERRGCNKIVTILFPESYAPGLNYDKNSFLFRFFVKYFFTAKLVKFGDFSTIFYIKNDFFQMNSKTCKKWLKIRQITNVVFSCFVLYYSHGDGQPREDPTGSGPRPNKATGGTP